MKQKPISKLEQQVMNIVWELQRCTVKEVHHEVMKEKKIVYTTVATVLLRLHKKGLVRKKMHGTFYFYSPKLSKESYSNTIVNSFFRNTVDAFGDTAILSFAQSLEKLPAKKREYLLTLLEEHDKNK